MPGLGEGVGVLGGTVPGLQGDRVLDGGSTPACLRFTPLHCTRNTGSGAKSCVAYCFVRQ